MGHELKPQRCNLSTKKSFKTNALRGYREIQDRNINFRSWKVNSIIVTTLADRKRYEQTLPAGKAEQCWIRKN